MGFQTASTATSSGSVTGHVYLAFLSVVVVIATLPFTLPLAITGPLTLVRLATQAAVLFSFG